MPRYADLRDSVDKFRKIVVDNMLRQIAFRQFEKDRGCKVRAVLPDKSEDYLLSDFGFEGVVKPNSRVFCNPVYNDNPITTDRIIADPKQYKNISKDIIELWWSTFGDNYHISDQPNHPGDPPMKSEDISNFIDRISDTKSIVVSDPMMEDLVNALNDKNYRIIPQFMNLDSKPIDLFEPGGTHELTELFTNGNINTVYKDKEIALLKPEYDHQMTEEVMNEQRRRIGRIVLNGEQPEMGFVVGIDDTPTGLFIHSVDATRLDPDQKITREYINNVMGFDYNFEKQDILNINVGDRVRLQGDLAIEKTSDNYNQDATRCNLPIDNHLAILNHGELVDGESKNEEPIEIKVPNMSTLNIIHDEHKNVTTDLMGGTYKFYLLRRGLRTPENRPDWNP